MNSPKMSKYFYESPQDYIERAIPLPPRALDKPLVPDIGPPFPFFSHRPVSEVWRTQFTNQRWWAKRAKSHA
jgi:hypothetical protein